MTFSHSNIMLLFGSVLILFVKTFTSWKATTILFISPGIFTNFPRLLPQPSKKAFFFVQAKKDPSNKDLPPQILAKCVYFSASQYGCVYWLFRIFLVQTKRKVVQGPSNKVTAQTVSKLSSKRAKCKAKLRSSVPKPLNRARDEL